MTLEEYYRTYHVPKKSLIHDNIDSTLSVTLTDGVAIPFPCTPDAYEYNTDNWTSWNPETSTFHDSIDDALVFPKFSLQGEGAKGVFVYVYVYIPHPQLGNQLVAEMKDTLAKNNVSERLEFNTWCYNGAEIDAKTYGFYTECEAVGGDVALTASSVGIAVI